MTRKPLAALLVVFFLTGSMAGCLGSGGLDVLPEKKGIPWLDLGLPSQQHVHFHGD